MSNKISSVGSGIDASVRAIALIGMPGSGKSTLGILLAKKLGWHFLDTDIGIQTLAGETLQQIVDDRGYMYLRTLEEQMLLKVPLSQSVIATGGSAIYSAVGMAHIKTIATIVYLKTSVDQLKHRIDDYGQRGIARRPEQSFDDLYLEREPLYRQYADITVGCGEHSPQEMIKKLALALEG
jgi:shikimate kinase